MSDIIIPPFATGVFSKLDWANANQIELSLSGLLFQKVTKFKNDLLLYTTVANIDDDGPGESKKVDPDWQSETSLRFPDLESVSSRAFPGVVVPPALEKLGAKIGDYGLLIWKDSIVGVQVYDIGPKSKVGEISIYAGRALGIIPHNQSDHTAATKGNGVTDLVTAIFCGSGPGHAVDASLIAHICSRIKNASYP